MGMIVCNKLLETYGTKGKVRWSLWIKSLAFILWATWQKMRNEKSTEEKKKDIHTDKYSMVHSKLTFLWVILVNCDICFWKNKTRTSFFIALSATYNSIDFHCVHVVTEMISEKPAHIKPNSPPLLYIKGWTHRLTTRRSVFCSLSSLNQGLMGMRKTVDFQEGDIEQHDMVMVEK